MNNNILIIKSKQVCFCFIIEVMLVKSSVLTFDGFQQLLLLTVD